MHSEIQDSGDLLIKNLNRLHMEWFNEVVSCQRYAYAKVLIKYAETTPEFLRYRLIIARHEYLYQTKHNKHGKIQHRADRRL